VHKAYNTEISTATVKPKCLDASTEFSTTQMTRIKPTLDWMLYLNGFS
jgi:hypothetical protein